MPTTTRFRPGSAGEMVRSRAHAVRDDQLALVFALAGRP